jgi:hypothetical protein
MTRRTFRDASGVDWRVWAYARVTTSGRASAPRLRFVSRDETRDLDALPHRWSDASACSVAALEEYCRAARPVDDAGDARRASRATRELLAD